MSGKVKIILSLILIIGILFLSGPRYKITTQLLPVELPADLDEYLKQSEGKFSDMVAGSEKTIIWQDSALKKKTRFSIVYIHGFSATRQELSPVCEELAKKIGANLFLTRLTGHGRGVEPMGSAKANEWLNDVIEAVAVGKRIGEEVIVMGTSTGATLAVWAAMQEDPVKDAGALVLISPNFYPANPVANIAYFPWGLQIGRMLIGDYREWEPRNEKEAAFWTWRYRIEVFYEMMGVVDLVDNMDLSKLKLPVLVIHSDRDQVIDVEKLKRKYKEIGSPVKKRVTVNQTRDEWGHILAGDIISPETTDSVVRQIGEFFQMISLSR